MITFLDISIRMTSQSELRGNRSSGGRETRPRAPAKKFFPPSDTGITHVRKKQKKESSEAKPPISYTYERQILSIATI